MESKRDPSIVRVGTFRKAERATNDVDRAVLALIKAAGTNEPQAS